MLLVFSFAITLKQYLHNLLADHTDYYGFTSGDEVTIGKTGFNCSTEDLVVPTPFIESSIEQPFYEQADYQEFSAVPYHFHFLSASTTKDLRGPPSAA